MEYRLRMVEKVWKWAGEKERRMKEKIQYHWQLEVYKMSITAEMKIFEISKIFPKEEKYSLTDQIRRSSRSVSSNIAEAWWRRRYEGAFIDKLNISETEAAETQVWLGFAVKCKYLDREIGIELNQIYDNIIGKLVNMANNPKPWLLKAKMSRWDIVN